MIAHLSSIESQDPSLALSFPMLGCLHLLNDFTMLLPHALNLGHSELFPSPFPDKHALRVLSFTHLSTPKHSDCWWQLASLPSSSLKVYTLIPIKLPCTWTLYSRQLLVIPYVQIYQQYDPFQPYVFFYVFITHWIRLVLSVCTWWGYLLKQKQPTSGHTSNVSSPSAMSLLRQMPITPQLKVMPHKPSTLTHAGILTDRSPIVSNMGCEFTCPKTSIP